MIDRSDGTLGELAFSLKPPKWLRKPVQSAINVLKPKVTVPTAAGPVEVTRDSVQRVLDAARNARVTVGARSPEAPSIDDDIREKVPGGYVTIALGALVVGALVAGLVSRKGGK